MTDSVLQDLRYAVRSLRASPLFTAIAVLTLALGIGATSTLFTVIDAVLLRPLPFPEADRIVSISESDHGTDRVVASSPDIAAWKAMSRSLSIVAAYTGNSSVFSNGGDPVQLRGARATPELFTVLGSHPILGRAIAAEDVVRGAPDVVVLSRKLWREAFGADPHVVGRAATLDGKPYTIIGVLDERAAVPRTAAYWLPLELNAASGGAVFFYNSLARIKPGVSLAAVAADLGAISKSLDAARPAAQRGHGVTVLTLHNRLYGSVRKPLTLLFGAVTFLLLIACANVANLMLARGATRRREIAVRIALGAGRARLVRQLLLESLVLALLGAGVGMVIPAWAVGIFVSLSPEVIGRVTDIHVNGQVLAFTAGLGVVTGLLFGLLPAWSGTRMQAVDPLKEGAGRGSGTPEQQRIRRTLVAAELALALLLLTGAGLLSRSFANVMAVDLGFQPEHLAAATVYLPRARYQGEAARAAFFDMLLARSRGIPGVQSVALSDGVPPNGYSMTMPLAGLSGRPDTTQVAITTVSREFPVTVGLQLKAGRLFDATDTPGTAPAVLLNAAAAHALFPGGDALGKQLRASAVTDRAEPATVIGVVKDVPQIGVDITPIPQAYFAREQVGGGEGFLVVRSSSDPVQLERMVRHAVGSIDPLQPVASYEQIDRALARSIAPRRLNFLLIDIFAGLALLLASIGLYGVMAFQVAQRTREVGIRMALGATSGAVRRMILRQGVAMIAVGCVAGMLLSFVASRLLTGLLYGVGVRDSATFLLAPAALCAVGMIACYLPVRRATAVDPMVALRNE